MRLLLSTAILFVMSLPLYSAEPFGLAIHLEGEVYVTRGILEFDAQVEEVLMWDDEVETGEDGSLQITFDSSFLSIGPNTLVTFEKEVTDDGNEIYRMILDEGRFRSKILNLSSRQYFEVVTDEGSLKVHGTDFVTQYSPDEDAGLQVSVLQGIVSMEGGSDDEGEVSSAPEEDAASEPVPTMVTQNQVGGVGGESGPGVQELSFDQADDLKEELPLPGDAETSLALDEIGLEGITLDAFSEDITEGENEVGEESVSIEDEVFEEIITEVELRIEADIDSPDLD